MSATAQVRRRGRTFVGTLVGVLGLLLAGVVAAEEPLPAEIMPLAHRSLLLDLAQAGERHVSVGERGHILLTADAGRSWRQVAAPVRSLLTAVFFVDARVGWVVGHDAAILRTDDGGESWQLQYFDPEIQTPLLDVWFRDRENGLAIGGFGMVLRTEDGGRSWQESILFDDDDFHLNQIVADDKGELWIAAERGHLYRSADHGVTWARADSPYEGSLFGVLPLGGEALLLYGLRGHLFLSEDAGASWKSLETGVPALLHDATRLRSGGAVVVGMDGVILHSAVASEDYRVYPQADRLGLTAVLQVGDALLLSGEGGVRRLELNRLARRE